MTPRSAPRRRIVAVAFACNPPSSASFFGGEDLLGWRIVNQVARFHDVSLITASTNRPGIESLARPTPGVEIHYVPVPSVFGRLRHRFGGEQVTAYAWQAAAGRRAKQLHEEDAFDLVHHVTYANDWMASHAGALLRDIPYVRGPGGGAHEVPPAFARGRGIRFWASQQFRAAFQKTLRLDPYFVAGQRQAAALLVCTNESLKALPRDWSRKAALFPVNGVTDDDLALRTAAPPPEPFTVSMAGKFLPLKAFDLGMRAFAHVAQSTDARLVVIGDGPERMNLERLARALGIHRQVSFPGWLPRQETMHTVAQSHVFLFPSLRDGGGGVVVEAMAVGTPVVCLDLAGPGLHVDETCGMKVRAQSPAQAVSDLARSISTLQSDSSLRHRLAAGASARAASVYHWDRLGERLRDIYEAAWRGSARDPSNEVPHA